MRGTPVSLLAVHRAVAHSLACTAAPELGPHDAFSSETRRRIAFLPQAGGSRRQHCSVGAACYSSAFHLPHCCSGLFHAGILHQTFSLMPHLALRQQHKILAPGMDAFVSESHAILASCYVKGMNVPTQAAAGQGIKSAQCRHLAWSPLCLHTPPPYCHLE